MGIKNTEEKHKIDPVSAPILLEIAKSEYALENEKRRNFDTRIGIFISLGSAILLFAFNNILNSPMHMFSNHFFLMIFQYIYILLVIVAIGTDFYGLFFLIKTCYMSGYRRVDITKLEKKTAIGVNEYSLVMCVFYREMINHNRDINDRKINLLQKGIEAIKDSLLILMVCFIQ